MVQTIDTSDNELYIHSHDPMEAIVNVLTWTIHQAAEAQEQEPPKPSLPLPGGRGPQMHIFFKGGIPFFGQISECLYPPTNQVFLRQ